MMMTCIFHRYNYFVNKRVEGSVPPQILPKILRPVLCEHIVHVLFFQLAFVSNAKQRIEPPDGDILRIVSFGV